MSESDSFSDREHYFGPSVGLWNQNNIWCSPEVFLLLCIYVHRDARSHMKLSLESTFLFHVEGTSLIKGRMTKSYLLPVKSLQPNT